MLSAGFRYLVRAVAGMIAVGFLLANLATAQAQSTVAQFLANPAQVLAQYPNGGAELISLIRDVAVSNPGALQSIVSLSAGASTEQQIAIGTGLGQAYNIVINTDQNYATQIAAAVAGLGSDVQTAFAGVSGNVATAATGAGGGGGGSGGATGGSGGAPSGGSNAGTGGTGGGTTTQTSTGTFTGGGGGTTGSGSVSAL